MAWGWRQSGLLTAGGEDGSWRQGHRWLEWQAAAFLVAKTLAWRQAGMRETSFARRFLKVGNLAQHLYDVFYLIFVMYSEREVCVEDAVHAVDVHFHDVELQL